jgi:hypothetical protein
MVTRRFVTLVALGAMLAECSSVWAGKRELTPADALATVRIVQNQSGTGLSVDNFASPDGKRYLVRLIYGDVKRNGVWMDLLTAPLSSLDAAAHPKRCAHLFTTGLGSLTSGHSAESDPDATNVIRWTDASHVSFLWSDQRATRQIMSLNLETCKHRFVTHMVGDVFSFLSTADGTSLINAQVLTPTGVSEKLWAQGLTVGDSTDGFSILMGHVEDENAFDAMYKNAWFIHFADTTRPLMMDGQRFDRTNPYSRDLAASPNGRSALVSVGIGPRPVGWDKYDNPGLQSVLTENEAKIRFPVRYAVIDLHAAVSHMLWDAPKAWQTQVIWSPTENVVLLAPTFLPVDSSDSIGLGGNAAATIDAATGDYQVLPVDLTNRTVMKAQWGSSSEISIASTDASGANPRTQKFTRINAAWHEAPDIGDTPVPNGNTGPVFLETRQTLNTPPQLFAIDSQTGSRRLILDPNPHLLTDFNLGRQERMSGTLPNGRPWIAQLIYPADFETGMRYPLVIQCLYGNTAFGPEEFSLTGTWMDGSYGLGPTPFAVYAGQSLASRNIAVLVLKVLHTAGGIQESDDRQLGFETLARQLVASGLVDENKIAIDGFSRNGYFVDYTLAHSAFPFAAAIAGDNYEPSYFQSALANWRKWDEITNGASAFGAGLQTWFAHAPGFNAEHIHTPLMMIGQSSGIAQIIGEWEIYSRLRHLHKPVEMYMMPQADQHPAHNTQNPRQIVAVQQKAIDWLDFWLTGREDPSPDKHEQYTRWHRLSASSAVANP